MGDSGDPHRCVLQTPPCAPRDLRMLRSKWGADSYLQRVLFEELRPRGRLILSSVPASPVAGRARSARSARVMTARPKVSAVDLGRRDGSAGACVYTAPRRWRDGARPHPHLRKRRGGLMTSPPWCSRVSQLRNI
jgi:hypothetical protein